MEDLRFLLPITAGKRPEVDPVTTPAEAETSEKPDFRSFLGESYSETANGKNDGFINDPSISNGVAGQEGQAGQEGAPLEKTFPTVNRSQALAIHARSKEIGRVIFTGDPSSDVKVNTDMESLNSGPAALLTSVVGDASGSSKDMVDRIRETMLGATEVASNISRARSGGELNKDQLAMLTSPSTNAWSEFTQQITSESSRSLVSTVKLTSNEPQFLPVTPDLNPTENSGVIKEQLASNIGQSGDLAKLIKPAMADFVSEPGSPDQDSMQASLNGSRGESGDQGGNQRDSEKQGADGRPSGSERDRQDWRERFAEIISSRIKVKVDEGDWLVRMSLQAAGLGSFDVSLKSDASGFFGSIHSDDPEVRELLNSALPELERALNESLSTEWKQKVRLEVSDSNSLKESGELGDSSEIVLSASELANSLPKGFKSDDGLDVFV